MRAFATPRHAAPLFVLLGAASLMLVGVRAEAQVNPLWDHYKV